jgi:tetratricopeptide (TPR) repeat protein
MNAVIVALNIAEILSDQGRSDEAGPIFHEAIELRRTGGIPLEIAEALSLLGRHEARVGHFAEAHAAFDEARELYRANDGADFDLITTEARRVECMVLEGRSTDALEAAIAALAIAEPMSGASVIVAALHRQRGWAFAQAGDLAEARAAFRESLETASGGGENYALISNDYEVALTLDALSRVERLAGITSAVHDVERDQILARLDVVRLPQPPLQSAS